MPEPDQPRVVVVTPQQRAVIGHLTWDGADNAEIARRLGISYECVRSHLARALRATGYDNRTELAVALLRKRLLLKTEDHRGRRGQKRTRP